MDRRARVPRLLPGPGVVSILYGLYCLTLPHTPPSPAGRDARLRPAIDKQSAVLESLELLRIRSFAVLVFVTGLVGIMLAFYFACENFFLEAIGIDPKNTGAYMTFGQVAEAFIILLVPISVAKLGVKRTMLIGAGAWALRFGLSAYGQPQWLMIATIGLHGFAFGFFFVVAQMYVDRAASGDIKASAQNLLIFVIYGLGTIVGSAISGWSARGSRTVVEGVRWTTGPRLARPVPPDAGLHADLRPVLPRRGDRPEASRRPPNLRAFRDPGPGTVRDLEPASNRAR